MNTTRLFSLSVLTLAALAGCNTLPPGNANLDEARNDYRMASEDQQTRDLAGTELQQAKEALGQANASWEHSDPTASVDHLAYLAKQRTAIARETGRQKGAEREVALADMARDKVRLAARTDEVVVARRDAATSQRQFEDSKQQAVDAQAVNADLQAQLKALNAKTTERGVVVTIGDVLFETDRAHVKSGGRRHLEQLAAFLNKFPQRKALIEGFTDSVGGEAHNMTLSSQRAEAVQSALVAQGVAMGRVSTRGYGEAFPVADNGSAAGRQMNRRVEVVISDDMGVIAPR